MEFSLTNGQVNADAAKTAVIALSNLAAKALALGEDVVILPGIIYSGIDRITERAHRLDSSYLANLETPGQK
jgi:hypothetical protein